MKKQKKVLIACNNLGLPKPEKSPFISTCGRQNFPVPPILSFWPVARRDQKRTIPVDSIAHKSLEKKEEKMIRAVFSPGHNRYRKLLPVILSPHFQNGPIILLHRSHHRSPPLIPYSLLDFHN